jgi:hypothetical protein
VNYFLFNPGVPLVLVSALSNRSALLLLVGIFVLDIQSEKDKNWFCHISRHKKVLEVIKGYL